MIKLAAIDLDGTSLGTDSRFTEKTVSTLRHLNENGIPVVIITGRLKPSMLHLYEDLGIIQPYSVGNGCQVWLDHTNMHHSLSITQEDAQLMMDFSKERGYRTIVIENGKSGRWSTEYSMGTEPWVRFEIESSDPLLWQELSTMYPNHDVLRASSGHYEILPKGASKGAALLKMCEHFNIDIKDVAAFGDEYNDISMLSLAGHGVAMGNGLKEVKDVARYVTGTNSQDGVVQWLNKHVL